MAEPTLTCNFPKCNKTISEKATVTICSHIFCQHHKIVPDEARIINCPACEDLLQGPNQVKFMFDVSPSEEWKSSVLTGYSYETIVEIMANGLRFWEYQLQLQTMQQKTSVHNIRTRLAHRESIIETMQLSIKHHAALTENKINHLKQEVEALTSALQQVEHKYNEKRREHFLLLSRYESLRQQSSALAHAQNECMDLEEEGAPAFNYRDLLPEREPEPPTPRFHFSPTDKHCTAAADPVSKFFTFSTKKQN